MKKTGLGIITLIAAMILSATVFILVILGMCLYDARKSGRVILLRKWEVHI